MTDLGYETAALLYLVAAVLGWRSRHGQGYVHAPVWLLSAGALAQAWGFVALHRQSPPVPLESFPAALGLIGWLTVVVYLLSLSLVRLRGVAGYVGAGAGVVSLAAALGLRWAAPIESDVAAAGAWSHSHVLLSAGGFSLLALASLAGFAYLTKESDLKRKQGSRLLLPALESLDRIEHLALSLGFPLLTLGVITGYAWGAAQGVSPWTGHALWLAAAWAVYLVPVGLRVVRRQRGPRPARSVVLGFALLAFSYIGIRLLGNGA